ncbi:hypothetical protein PMAYCL1PPCAC_03207, partial [Pristionchus mayeri]
PLSMRSFPLLLLFSLFSSLSPVPIDMNELFKHERVPPLHIISNPSIIQKTNETAQMINIVDIFEKKAQKLVDDTQAEMRRELAETTTPST